MIQSTIHRIIPWSWALIWFMLVFSMKGSMLSLWIFSLLVITYTIIVRPRISFKPVILLILPAMLFLWYMVSGLIHSPFTSLWPLLERKGSLLLIPALIILARSIPGVNIKWAMRGLIAALLLSGIHLLARAMLLFASGDGYAAWTYHAFTEPYGIGAIYYSWYIAIAIAYMVYSSADTMFGQYYNYLILFLLALLLLSSSKLFIILVVPIVIWHFWQRAKTRRLRIIYMSLMAMILLVGATPFMNRMADIKTFDTSVITQDQYTYDTPLNGVSLRLIQWRFGLEILNENQLWFSGAGLAKTQDLLNKKYLQYGLYTGNDSLDDTGYLDYNFHNQFVETLVSTGIIGLLILLLLLGTVVAKQKFLIFPTIVILYVILFFMTESVLERQAGILVFCMITCFARDKEIKPKHSNDGFRLST